MSVTVKFSGDASELEKEIDKLQKAQQKLLDQMQRTNKESKVQASEAAGKNKEWLGSVTKIAGTYLSVRAAIDLVNNSNERSIRLMREAAEATQSLSTARMRLAQVSGGDPQVFSEMKRKAAQISAQTGISAAESNELVFAGQSSGFYNQIDGLVTAIEAVGPEATTLLAGKTTNLFGGALSPRQTISGAMAAAQQSDSDVFQIAQTLPGVAAASTGTGVLPNEMMGAIGVFDKVAASAGQGATELAAFLQKVNMRGDRQGIDKSGTLAQILDQVAKLDETQLRDVFGEDQSSNNAIRKFANNRKLVRDFSDRVKAAIDNTGTPNDVINQTVASRFADPTEMAARDARIAAAQELATNEAVNSLKGSQYERSNSNLNQALAKSGLSSFSQYWGYAYGQFANTAGRMMGNELDQARVGVRAADPMEQYINTVLDPLGFEGSTGTPATQELQEIMRRQLAEQRKLTSLIEQQSRDQRKRDQQPKRQANPVAQAAAQDERS